VTAKTEPSFFDGWTSASLDELGAWTGGGTPSKSNAQFWDGEVPWVSPKDMKSLRLVDTRDHISEKAIEESAAKTFRANSIAFVVRSGILEHTLPIALVPFRATANQDMKVLTPSPEISVDWLLYALVASAADIREQCRKHGTTVASIDFPKLKRYRIGVPPRAAQDRISSATESRMIEVDAGSSYLHQASDSLKRLRKAVLNELIESTGHTQRLDEIGTVFVGATPRRGDAQSWGGEIPWVSSGEVAFCHIKETREHLTEQGLGDAKKRLHPPGTVLLAMYGEGKTRGQAAVLDIEAATNQAVAAIRTDRSKALPEFVYYALMAKYEQTRQIGQGGQQINLNKELVKSIEIPCPPLDEQEHALAQIRTRLNEIETVGSLINERVPAVDGLRRAILKSVLTGSLTERASA
jgi:type I restriction enzyme S subunit